MSASSSSPSEALSGYPVQQHAGKVGYGPNYNAGASVVDKVEGLVEEVTGKVIHNPKLVNKGHGLHTGEVKKKQLLGEESDQDPVFDQKQKPENHNDLKSKPEPQPGTKASGTDPHFQSTATASSRGVKEPTPAASSAIVPSKGTDATEHVKSH